MQILSINVSGLALTLAATLLTLSGCSSVDYSAGEPQYRPGPRYPATTPSSPSTAPVIKDSPKWHTPETDAPSGAPAPSVARAADAIDSLAVTAAQDYQRGDYQTAIATAERGLRINRRSPDLYLVMAQSYVKLNQPDRARSFVEQGLRYASPGTSVYESLQRVNDAVGF